jgi:tetratricopeptide (TPR) repeat protein
VAGFRTTPVLLIGAALVVGCTHRAELKRSPFITPLPEGGRQAIAAPEGSPTAEPAAEDLVPPGSPAARTLAELQDVGGGSGVRPAQAVAGPTVDVEEEARRVAADPRNVASRLALARAYHHERIFDLALEHYEAARELAPEDPEIARDLGRLWVDAGQPALGLTFLEEAIRGQPLDPATWSYRGIALDLLSRFPEGEEALRHAIALDRRRWDFHNNLGYNLLLQERYAEAADAFRAGLALAPGHPTLENNLGLALGFQDLLEDALAAFRRAGSEAGAWNNLGVVHRYRGELQAAEEAFARAARLEPGSREIAKNLRESRRLVAEGPGVGPGPAGQSAALAKGPAAATEEPGRPHALLRPPEGGKPRVVKPVAIGARLPAAAPVAASPAAAALAAAPAAAASVTVAAVAVTPAPSRPAPPSRAPAGSAKVPVSTPANGAGAVAPLNAPAAPDRADVAGVSTSYRLELMRANSEEIALRGTAELRRRWGAVARVKQSDDLFMVQAGGLTLAQAEALRRAALHAGYRSARVLDAFGRDVPVHTPTSPPAGSR